jgi:bacillithiol biosynthesis deacetylase BshB1
MTVEVLAVGAHPDDVELGCGGTLARLAAGGRSFAILSLTRGESGSRGTTEQRKAEAAEGGRILGAAEVVLLDCGDGALRRGTTEEDAVIAELRRLRPALVLLPPPRDRHPDHERACALVREACYYAGLRRRGAGEPHRPSLVLSYELHQPFEPTLVVDIAETFGRKLEALRAHRSQLHGGPQVEAARESAAPATWVSSAEFWAAIEARARVHGARIGCTYGEAFLAYGPLAVVDPLWLLAAPPRAR